VFYFGKFPLDYAVSTELVELFKEELEACAIKAGDSILLFTDPRTNPHYPAAFFGAAKLLGAYVMEMKVPFFVPGVVLSRQYSDAVLPPRGPLEAMKAVDLVIDMSTVGWLYTNVHNEVLRSGTRTLMVKQPEDILRRLRPDPAVKKRTLAGAKVMEAGHKLRITTAAGTDLTFDKTGRKAAAQYGASDVPGRWDHWPSGQVATAPIETSAEGRLVLNTGDIILRVERFVNEPITCEFRGGRIVSIEGGGAEGFLLREYMQQWKDDRAYIAAHVGWGTEHRAVWYEVGMPGPGGTMDAESFYGNILLGVGANHFIGLGGKNETSAHIDLCLRGCNLWVDDLQVLKEGSIVPADLK
jgi:2,5-dihydroxypyridine 5,6-dioxygenase